MSGVDPETTSIVWDVLLLSTWNTRVVILGVAALGTAGGAVGSFMLLRKRVLLGDALSHATLPGLVLAFLLAPMIGLEGKSMGILLVGALLSGVLGILTIQFLARSGRLSEDASLAIVIGTFFGAGVALLGLAQQDTTSSAAGIESFIYGKTASMLARDAILIACIGLGAVFVCVLLFKELRLVCFDQAFARGQGMPTTLLDLTLMILVVAMVIVGLQAVGLILVIAVLVIPPAAARFWTDSTARMLVFAGLIGGVSAWVGAAVSALLPRLPAGATIVLVMAAFFLVSLLAGSQRGLIHRALALKRHRTEIEREHALRAAWECMEQSGQEACTLDAVAARRGWTVRQARTAFQRLVRRDLAQPRTAPEGVMVRLTPSGRTEAADVVRRHRLWEHYLIRRADYDAGHVDRGADELEHLLPREMLAELEAELEATGTPLPGSPHRIGQPPDDGARR